MSNFKEIFYDAADINVQTGTVYTASISDNFNYIAMRSSNPNKIHITNDNFTFGGIAYNFPVGSEINLIQSGSGKTTIEPGPGVVIDSSQGRLSISNQGAGATLIKFGSNQWKLIGSLSV